MEFVITQKPHAQVFLKNFQQKIINNLLKCVMAELAVFPTKMSTM